MIDVVLVALLPWIQHHELAAGIVGAKQARFPGVRAVRFQDQVAPVLGALEVDAEELVLLAMKKRWRAAQRHPPKAVRSLGHRVLGGEEERYPVGGPGHGGD